ncbi:hypothetical protein [Acinetobacter sp. 3657]|uniref:hypothetical protein n=1 Tax=Acinetobacter sp. 3657 TaxID=2817764 RepID=UPI00285B5892|nr:hypothetical protein [Prolinoborus sp. 3657]
MKFNFSLDTAIIVTLTAIFLFALGQAYLGGLLRPFYVDPLVLNFSVQDKIYWGFIKGQAPLIYFFIISTLFYVSRYIFVSAEIDQKIVNLLRSKIKLRLPHEVKPHNTSLEDERERNYSVFTFTTIIIYMLFLGAIFSLSHIEQKGKAVGQTVLKDMEKQPLVKIIGMDTDLKQYRILCGSALCAVIDEQKNVSLVEPKNVVYLSYNFAEKPEKNS